jgi:hypothetical protein
MGKREQALAEYQALLNRENVFRSHTRVAGREEALPKGETPTYNPARAR